MNDLCVNRFQLSVASCQLPRLFYILCLPVTYRLPVHRTQDFVTLTLTGVYVHEQRTRRTTIFLVVAREITRYRYVPVHTFAALVVYLLTYNIRIALLLAQNGWTK